MNSDLSLKIIELGKDDHQGDSIVKYLEDLLSKDPKNIELWLRLAIIEIDVPRVDYDKSFACLDRVFELDKDNLNALFILAYANNVYCGITQEIFNKLNAIITDSFELNSMLKYVMSWYYADKGEAEQQEKYLLESIQFYDGHVWNYVYLARCYIAKNKHAQANVLIQKALSNVVKVYTDENLVIDDDPTDIDEYINEHIKGIYITDINLEGIKEELSL